jgi:hypothetical protein
LKLERVELFDGVALALTRALKTVRLIKREEHQNRYVWKITPNPDKTPKTLLKVVYVTDPGREHSKIYLG